MRSQQRATGEIWMKWAKHQRLLFYAVSIVAQHRLMETWRTEEPNEHGLMENWWVRHQAEDS